MRKSNIVRTNVSTGTPWEAMAGYSRAVRIGMHVAVSGTTASNANGEVQHAGDAGAQATYIIRKIEAALNDAGAQLSDVIRTRVFVANIDDWEAVARAHGAIFGDIRPANTCSSYKSDVIKKPDKTKNRSTPMYPPENGR